MRAVVFALCLADLACAEPPAVFVEHTIARDLKGGYQVVAVDLNKDGKPDLLVVAMGMQELVWYENPGWERHVIAGNLSRMINVAAWDTDGDGIPELVLAHEFSNQAKDSLGIVSRLEHDGDPRRPWKITEIDRIPTSHRLRWADIAGDSHKVLISAPLTGPKAEAPDYRGHTPLLFYRPGEWKRQVIGEENEGVTHGMAIVDWDGAGRDAILTAGFTGIHLYRLGKDGAWTRTEIAKGDPAPWPKSGSSDVAVGHLGKRRYIAAIEPWHGNQVVVYQDGRRSVIDDALTDGHTIAAADFNGDGRDEIVAGFRGAGGGVFIYSADDAAGTHWSKQVLDSSGMAAAACAVADLNGDGRADVACIGQGTSNLKWYENRGPR